MSTSTPASGPGFSGYVLDDADNGRFLVDRGIYRDQALFEAEMARIFEGGWVYLCHESELARHGDYVTRYMGRQPVVVNRRKDGSIGAFVNACAHRGTVVAPCARDRPGASPAASTAGPMPRRGAASRSRTRRPAPTRTTRPCATALA